MVNPLAGELDADLDADYVPVLKCQIATHRCDESFGGYAINPAEAARIDHHTDDTRERWCHGPMSGTSRTVNHQFSDCNAVFGIEFANNSDIVKQRPIIVSGLEQPREGPN